MSLFVSSNLNTQNELLMKNLMEYYNINENLKQLLSIINGEYNISLRIVDWFVTNFAKKYYTVYNLPIKENSEETYRFKVYNEYKLKLKAYNKKRFDPFCRWERITIPFENQFIETTIGQLNFFKWALENKIIDYIHSNYADIENDMIHRNSTSKRKDESMDNLETIDNDNNKTRKKRQELSVSACKCIKKETVKIVVKFNL